ncbi:MAG: DUF4433 domain-containing protein [Saprospiraceae bacterium]
MTHIVNLPHILLNGITHFTSKNANPSFVPIGDKSLISARGNFILNNGRRLGEYIPFYFGVRTPMLYVIQKGYNMVQPTHAENIVYCVSSIQNILDRDLDFIFTDGHAVDSFSTQHNKENIDDIDTLLDFEAINSRYWKDEKDLDLKRRKEAEFLVNGDVSSDDIIQYIVYNGNAKTKLISYGIEDSKIVIEPDYYF